MALYLDPLPTSSEAVDSWWVISCLKIGCVYDLKNTWAVITL